MNRIKALSFLPILLLVAVSISSCSGPKAGTVIPGNGTATVSFTLVADTLPPNPSILSFKVSIISVTLTPTSGTAISLQPPSPIVVDLMRLQSDTAFLGTLANVPSGSYTVQVSLSSEEMTFLNDTTATITANGTACLANTVCTIALTGIGQPTIASFTFATTANGLQGLELDFNLNNAITLTAGSLSVNFAPAAPLPGVFTAFTLPRANSNLASNQLELLEDFTGVVSVNANTVTITSTTRGALTTTSTSTSTFDPSPDGTICPSVATISCVVNGQVASVDAFLNTDGTLSLAEFEPLNATQQDFVEGTVFSVISPTQFDIAVTDKIPAATNPLIGALNTGDLLTVNIPAPNSFLVDSKGLAIPAGSLGLFQGQIDTSAIHPGQTVAIHVTTFTAATPTVIAIATADTVTLRWSRFTASPVTSTTQLLTVTALPSYFTFTPPSQFVSQLFANTNFDGVSNGGSLNGDPVALRALYLQNSSNTANPTFFPAKVRQH
jgi:hypothetical protein